jgi:hypothetical protein
LANSACAKNSLPENWSSSGQFSFFRAEAGATTRIHSSGRAGHSGFPLEKRGTLNASKESTPLNIQKIGRILKPLVPFLKDRGIVYLKDVKTGHLSAFQETWLGRLRKNRATGEFVGQPKSQLGKQKNQEFAKMFFRRPRSAGSRRIPHNWWCRSRHQKSK